MSYKRCDLAVCARHGDTLVDTAGEVGNTVLKIVMRNLHNIYKTTVNHLGHTTIAKAFTRVVLNDRDIGALCKLASGVAETIL